MPITQEVAVVILKDDEGNYFIHQRCATKSLFPNLWGVGAGGKVEPGEPPHDAALRELWEETGCAPHIQHRFDLEYRDDDLLSEIHVFEAAVDRADLGFHESEWQAARWCTESELKELTNTTGVLCPDTTAFMKHYFTLTSSASASSHAMHS